MPYRRIAELSPAERTKLIRLLQDGKLSQETVAARFGIRQQSVSDFIKSEHIPRKNLPPSYPSQVNLQALKSLVEANHLSYAEIGRRLGQKRGKAFSGTWIKRLARRVLNNPALQRPPGGRQETIRTVLILLGLLGLTGAALGAGWLAGGVEGIRVLWERGWELWPDASQVAGSGGAGPVKGLTELSGLLTPLLLHRVHRAGGVVRARSIALLSL